MLEKQRDNLLAFAVELDRELAALAQEWQISVATAREVLQVQSLPTWDAKRWRREAALRRRYAGVITACVPTCRTLDRVVRASSLVENLNSRLAATSSCGGRWEGLLDVASVLPEPPPVPAQ